MWENIKDTRKQPHWATWLVFLFRDTLPQGCSAWHPLMGRRREGSRECKSLGWRGHLQSPGDTLQGHLATWRSAPLWKQLQLLHDHFTPNRRRQVKLLFTLLIRTSRKQWAAWRERTKPYLTAHLPWERLALIPRTSSYNNLSSPPPSHKPPSDSCILRCSECSS